MITLGKNLPVSESNQQQPVVIKQGGSGTGIGLVLAALILGGALVYAVTIWSNTQKRNVKETDSVRSLSKVNALIRFLKKSQTLLSSLSSEILERCERELRSREVCCSRVHQCGVIR